MDGNLIWKKEKKRLKRLFLFSLWNMGGGGERDLDLLFPGFTNHIPNGLPS